MGRGLVRALLAVGAAALMAIPGAGRLAHGRTRRAAGSTAQESLTKVVVELFQVALIDDETIAYRRDERLLDARGPDAALADLMPKSAKGPAFLAGEPAIVHSTSWRYEKDGTVVLTYLAYGESLSPQAEATPGARTVRKRDLPQIGTTDPEKPRPPTIKYEDVLAHGLRHLALLARRTGNDAFATRLATRSRKFFASIEPEVAGEIRDGARLYRTPPQGNTGP